MYSKQRNVFICITSVSTGNYKRLRFAKQGAGRSGVLPFGQGTPGRDPALDT